MNTKQKMLAALVCGLFAATLAADAAAQAAGAPAAAKPAAAKPAAKQRTFASPEEAATALVDAVKAKDVDGLLAVVGPDSRSWLFSGDKVADANDWNMFVQAYDARRNVKKEGDAKAILEVGADDWPFPAPLVKKGSAWAFDATAGREELINRRVGRNELDTIQTMLAIVDAQREYAASDADGNGFADYATRFLSTKGKKDGLYWPDESGKPQSPLGPLIATASAEGYGKKKAADGQRPSYHGYHYKLITSQGKDAPGGAYDYMVKGKLLGGFAVVAWPSSYRNSGVTTFIVNHDGVVYEKDLGPQTDAVASGMAKFNPDKTWRKAQ